MDRGRNNRLCVFCTWTDELVESGSTEKGITIVWSDVAAGCPI